jgi:hypothetical protein
MKKLFLLSTCFAFSFGAFTQSNELESNHNNEFGLDVSGFIRFFTQFQTTSDYSYSPTYYLTYRRLFEPGNIRFGIGGDYDNIEPTGILGDSNTYNNINQALGLRLGWEFKSILSKRWEVFYGLDYRMTFESENNEVIFFNGGYANGRVNKSQVYGLAPVLGFRFNINKRISLITEASLSFNILKTQSRLTYTSLYGNPEKPDDNFPNTSSFFMNFSQPISIFFVFNI